MIISSTDDGCVMAISQILYGQYHIWDIHICVRPENQIFVGK